VEYAGHEDGGGSCTAVNDGLIAHLTMDKASVAGGYANDTSGNGNDGELIRFPSPPTLVAGRFGEALSFPDSDGGGAYVSIPSLPLDSTPDHMNSVSLWFYRNDQSVDDALLYIGGFPLNDLWLLGASLGFDRGSNTLWGTTDQSLLGRWIHVVAIFDNGPLISNLLYVDGRLRSPSCVQSNDGTCSGYSATAMAPVTFGGTPDTGHYYRGALDEIRIYNRALTASQARTLFEGTACP
jgi:hypothetical protein